MLKNTIYRIEKPMLPISSLAFQRYLACHRSTQFFVRKHQPHKWDLNLTHLEKNIRASETADNTNDYKTSIIVDKDLFKNFHHLLHDSLFSTFDPNSNKIIIYRIDKSLGFLRQYISDSPSEQNVVHVDYDKAKTEYLKLANMEQELVPLTHTKTDVDKN